MTKPFLQRIPILIAAFAVLVSGVGCEQQRYQPAVWQPDNGNGTLPSTDASANGNMSALAGTLPTTAGGTLALRGNGTSLPTRMRMGSSLPINRGASVVSGSTLPLGGTTLAIRPSNTPRNRKSKFSKPPLPNLAGKDFWDTSPKRDMGPVQGKPGLYSPGGVFSPMGQNGSGSTLPRRSFGAGTTLPQRNGYGGSTLPTRSYQPNVFGNPLYGGSTLPARGSTLPRR